MSYIAFDTETTGIEPGSRMIEIAAIAFDGIGNILKTFNTLVNPGMPIPADATKVNNITDVMVESAPDTDKALCSFFDWLPLGTLVAHYAQYDTGIITYEAGRVNMPLPEGLVVIDTCEIAKTVNETKNNKLTTLAAHYGLKYEGEAHRAVVDTDLVKQLFMLYKNREIPESPIPWEHAGHDYKYPDELPDSLAGLPYIISKGEQLPFSYKDAKGDVTERNITPYGIAETSKGLMFHGWCHMREARRTFRADRIIAPESETAVAQ